MKEKPEDGHRVTPPFIPHTSYLDGAVPLNQVYHGPLSTQKADRRRRSPVVRWCIRRVRILAASGRTGPVEGADARARRKVFPGRSRAEIFAGETRLGEATPARSQWHPHAPGPAGRGRHDD